MAESIDLFLFYFIFVLLLPHCYICFNKMVSLVIYIKEENYKLED